MKRYFQDKTNKSNKEKTAFEKMTNIATIIIVGLVFLFFAVIIIGAMKNFIVEHFFDK